ncbi:MAG TPA: hypothetical protein VEH77_04295 [Roseiarcus sp.]|nr:hypothetical protein [Roseiarcus sp.]
MSLTDKQIQALRPTEGRITKLTDGAEYWEERVRMMQWWADRLDALRLSGEVISLLAAR